MVARIDWLNDCVERMLSGKRPLTAEQWGMQDSIMSRDIDLLRQAAALNSLRGEMAEPSPRFVERLRERMLAEAGELSS